MALVRIFSKDRCKFWILLISCLRIGNGVFCSDSFPLSLKTSETTILSYNPPLMFQLLMTFQWYWSYCRQIPLSQVPNRTSWSLLGRNSLSWWWSWSENGNKKTGQVFIELDLELQRKTCKEVTSKDARDSDLNRNPFKTHSGKVDFDVLLQKEWAIPN